MSRFSLAIILFLIPISISGQFTHRFEFSVAAEAYQQVDLNQLEKFGIEYHEDNSRTGAGFNTGFQYVFNHIPFSVSMHYSYKLGKGNRYTFNTNITTFEQEQTITVSSTSLNIHLDLFRSSSFTPYVYCGIDLISMNLKRSNVENFGYMREGFTFPVIWGYESIEAQICSFGFVMGAGLKYRISDKAGAYFDICFNRFSQDDTIWLGEKVSIRSVRLGTYFRFSKRKQW